MSSELSGGLKRMLNLAIAVVSAPKILILDEPTSGMDPLGRRKVWDLLIEGKKERLTILSTHYMDEADIVSDRIAMMQEGEVICVGSSLYLKDRFGIGYNLTIYKEENNQSISDNIHEFIIESDLIPELISEVSNEI
jgi:ATP-binding cassette subfamily A (ABC1) protein 3